MPICKKANDDFREVFINRNWGTNPPPEVAFPYGEGGRAILFNNISGDDLSFRACYAGKGIVEITVENDSDKNLSFQPKLKRAMNHNTRK